MSVTEKNTEEPRQEASPELRDLLLSRKVWTQAIERLGREKGRLTEVAEVAEPEASNRVRLRLAQIDHETAMYEICIDRVQERAEQAGALPTRRRSDGGNASTALCAASPRRAMNAPTLAAMTHTSAALQAKKAGLRTGGYPRWSPSPWKPGSTWSWKQPRRACCNPFVPESALAAAISAGGFADVSCPIPPRLCVAS